MRYGQIVDLHHHFLNGNPSWFTHTIEPSLRGASEVRAAFLPTVLKARMTRSPESKSIPETSERKR
jgi:hypothetical protein